MQSVLADALAAETAPDDADALKRWLFGVARHKIADFHRRTKRAPHPDDSVDDRAAPSSGREGASDLLEWAEGELPPGSDAKRTFEWMLREGEGEKLESIAETEKVPAPRVRKRVSRMREHFRARWAAYVAALAAAGLAVIVVFYILRKKPEPEAQIVPEKKTPLDLAKEERGRALAACDRAEWETCIAGLDHAAQTDPAGDRDARVVQAREAARKALTPTPLPTPPPSPTPTPSPTTPPPRPTATPTSVTPTAPIRSSGTGGSL